MPRRGATLPPVSRTLPPAYAGWERHEGQFRRLTTPELILEIQDGSPDRRLAALAVIDLAKVDQAIVEDWIRTLPAPEANELAGAIPAQRQNASCAQEARWVEVAQRGYERRKLPTFLVMLMSALEALQTRGCAEAGPAWESSADWLGEMYDQLAAARNKEALADLSLFVFESYLGQEAIFEAFCGAIVRHARFAREVSVNPSVYLSGLPLERQRRALVEAAGGGGLAAGTVMVGAPGAGLSEAIPCGATPPSRRLPSAAHTAPRPGACTHRGGSRCRACSL